MSGKIPESLLRHLQSFSQHAEQHQYVLVPVDDFSIYRMLTNEIARTVANIRDEEFHIFVDTQTASCVDAVDLARTNAATTFVFGEAPSEWSEDERVIAYELPETITINDCFFAVIAHSVTFAIVGEHLPEDENGMELFQGVWTSQRGCVQYLVNYLLGLVDEERTVELLLPPDKQIKECSMGCSIRLTALLARQLSLRQRDMAMDKNVLSSVLNILKTISAKRRAHDILFVFVEQIAKAVKMDRCSVVQVWGGEEIGHVLASHDDENVNDLTIDLKKYPEIFRSMETRGKVAINDAARDPLMRSFADSLRTAQIQSLLVIPIVLFDQHVGSFFLRAVRKYGTFSLREINFCEIVAEAAANALERAHLFESIQKANERLEQLAITDGLTSVYNHRYFRERLEEEFARAKRYKLPLSCIILDVDNFKRVNDTYGHLQGDSVLREIAARSSQSVRKTDIIARYGGEEFVIIMPQTSCPGVQVQADRILKEIGTRPFAGMPPGHNITVSIGVAILNHDTMLDCESLIRVADGALYQAKREGKNRVVIGEE